MSDDSAGPPGASRRLLILAGTTVTGLCVLGALALDNLVAVVSTWVLLLVTVLYTVLRMVSRPSPLGERWTPAQRAMPMRLVAVSGAIAGAAVVAAILQQEQVAVGLVAATVVATIAAYGACLLVAIRHGSDSSR